MEEIGIGMTQATRSTYEQVLERLPELLKGEGFGVLTQIDVKSVLKEKLGVEFRRFKILGACNPALAHRALALRLDAGLMLPCNLTVYEGDDGHAVVSAVDPMQSLAGADPGLAEIAGEVRARLARVLDQLA